MTIGSAVSAASVRDDARADRSGTRAISPVIGVVLLLAVTICLVAVVTAGIATWSIDTPAPTAAFELQADGDDSTITLEHIAGDSVTVDQLSLTVRIDNTELEKQPPIPFVGAEGFRGTPDGPFNAQADSTWQTGERTTITLAGNNTPSLKSGDTVTVTLGFDGQLLTEVETTAT
ncbi:type IV pilin [Natrialba taiwanensis]|uniref:Flagellin domain-containing protein n=1 Tax=Natrialba taiwanensis DSM 12281 TaxID=1230458 RepID=M0A6A3_9EURY|nr:type IV pilin N-terminal domain-containing protein [Natrialba taiwanensis]ELY94074.1 flagellin domain-containing protein [Natrialba taiwanensis DSM 12281]